MKFLKSKLDEGQEFLILRVESVGLRLAAIGLLLSAMVQTMTGAPPAQWIGEYIAAILICLYVLLVYFKNGIWYRFSEPGIKTYIRLSIYAGSAATACTFIGMILVGFTQNIAVDIAVVFSVTFTVSFVGTVLFSGLCKFRNRKLKERKEKV